MAVNGDRTPCLNYSNLRQANESAAQTASRRPNVKAKTFVLHPFPPIPSATPHHLSAFLLAHPPDRETKLFRGIGCFNFDSLDVAWGFRAERERLNECSNNIVYGTVCVFSGRKERVYFYKRQIRVCVMWRHKFMCTMCTFTPHVFDERVQDFQGKSFFTSTALHSVTVDKKVRKMINVENTFYYLFIQSYLLSYESVKIVKISSPLCNCKINDLLLDNKQNLWKKLCIQNIYSANG